MILKKIKNKQKGPNLSLKSFAQRRKLSTNKKTTYIMEENICKQCNQKGVNIQKCTNSLYNSISKKPNNLIKKWAEDLNRHFSKEEILMANRHLKRCSTPLDYH